MMTAVQINKECSKCRFRKIFDCDDNFRILGCMHEPYHGKWVTEIDECPKNKNQRYAVIEAGWDYDDVPFVHVQECVGKMALSVFQEKLISHFGYEGDELKKEFIEKYANNIVACKYDDYEKRYIIQIKELKARQ